MDAKARGLKEGYRSGLEESIADDLQQRGVKFRFEPYKVEYEQPKKSRHYTPDFEISFWCEAKNKFVFIIIESKGRFVVADRQKHLMIKDQHPLLDVRFVFQNPNQKISKKSKTSYAMWCDHNGFKWSKKTIPEEWLR